MSPRRKAGGNRKAICLALQGGGAHGAYSWGVLDGLLQDGRIAIEGISGTSAGAINAVALISGYADGGGAEGARAALEKFWRAVSEAARMSPVQRSPLDMLLGNWSLDYSPGYVLFDLLSRFASPYDFNPLNLNPLKDLLEAQIDFERVRGCADMRLFVAATNVRTGKVKVFPTEELSAEAVMASACLPYLYQAVEIDGTPYWDGGYMGNPVLYPLIYGCRSRDVLLVQINPIERADTPKTAREIVNRVNEISFNSSLLRELRTIEFVGRLVEEHKLDESRYKRLLMHRIGGDDELAALSASSKLNAEWHFLTHLRDMGCNAAQRWLERNFESLGAESTIDLREMFQ